MTTKLIAAFTENGGYEDHPAYVNLYEGSDKVLRLTVRTREEDSKVSVIELSRKDLQEIYDDIGRFLGGDIWVDD